MFRIIRIKGSSMEPQYHNGDFVIVGAIRWFPIHQGHDIVFWLPSIGLLIKKLIKICDDGFYVKGTNPNSLTSEQIGQIPHTHIMGRVLLQFSLIKSN